MSAEPAVLVLLREHLEREIAAAAASILFEALADYGPRVPASFAEVVNFVHGPLRARLAARSGDEKALAVVRALERALRLAELPTQQLAKVPRRAFDEETTKTLARVAGTLTIAVVSASGALAERIDAILDTAKVAITDVRRLADLDGQRAHLALVDATDLSAIAPDALARALSGTPLVLVWGSDAEPAAAILSALERAVVPAMGFSRSEPVDPMIDVLRSRLDTAHVPPPWVRE